MADISKIYLTGRVGKDPEGQYTPTGKYFCKTSLAVSVWDAFKKTEVTVWYNIAVWGNDGEQRFVKWVKKGNQLAVEGNFSINEWKDKEGNAHHSYEVNVGAWKNFTKNSNDEDQSTPYDGE